MEESLEFENEPFGEGSVVLDSNFMKKDNSIVESIKVLVRVRPLNEKELGVDGENTTIKITSHNSLAIRTFDNRKSYNCSYDTILSPSATQAQVYDCIKDCTLSVMQGVNSTIFAYGQTGSGKTHSMYGPPSYMTSSGVGNHVQTRDTDLLGVIPRAIHHIFELAKSPHIIQFQVHCSFVQIYNENLFDMLRDSSMNTPLTIREDANKEIYVQGLSEYNVKSVMDTLQLLKIAEENRAIRETHMNQFSSRSHSIFTIAVEQKCMAKDGGEVSYRSKFNLVDLAGSEKWDLSKDLRDEHIQEMNNINLSLHTLGKCISALAKASKKQRQQQQQQSRVNTASNLAETSSRSLTASQSLKDVNNSQKGYHIPYRESKLTRLLQDSLGGNAKTYLIATISPAKINADESISTLKFADRAKQVMVQATINESRPADHALVQRLQLEVSMWKSIVKKVIGYHGYEALQSFISVSQRANQKLLQQSEEEADEEDDEEGDEDGDDEDDEEESVRKSHQTSSSLATVHPMLLSDIEIQLANALAKEISFPAVPLSHSRPPPTQHSSHPSQPPQAITSIRSSNASPTMAFPGSHSVASSSYYRYSDEEKDNLSVAHDPNHRNISAVPCEGREEGTGGGLEYVISLEKALNKEQIHAQHLAKKNETLIKEIEELKVVNLQLSRLQEQQQLIPVPSSSSRPSSRGLGDGLLVSYGPQFQTISSQLQQLYQQCDQSFAFHDQIQRTMKKFFKFQIEEEELKQEMNQLFTTIKDLRQQTHLHLLREDAETLSKLFQEVQRLQQHQHPTNGSNTASSGLAGQPRHPKPKEISSLPPRNLPQLPSTTTNNNTSLPSNPHSIGKKNSGKSSLRMEDMHESGDDVDEFAAPLSSGNLARGSRSKQPSSSSSLRNNPSLNSHPHSQSRSSEALSSHIPPAPHPTLDPIVPSNIPTSQTQSNSGISFRVRAGPGTVSSEGSIGWTTASQQQLLEDEEEEERLKAELKRAKKKQKQREKLQQWAREKEERAAAELKAQEEERKAMQEAELLREAKRKEYAQKQKQKLQSYQEKVDQEKLKIQQLIDLGIDPKSLNI